MIRCPACTALNRPEASACVVCGVALGGDLTGLGKDTVIGLPTSLRARLEEAIARGDGGPAPGGPATAALDPGRATLYGQPPGFLGQGGAEPGPPPGAPDLRQTLYGRPPGPPPEVAPDPLRQTLYGRPPAEEPPADPFEPPPRERTHPGRPGPATGPLAGTPLPAADLRRTRYGMQPPPGAAPPPALSAPPPRVAPPTAPSLPAIQAPAAWDAPPPEAPPLGPPPWERGARAAPAPWSPKAAPAADPDLDLALRTTQFGLPAPAPTAARPAASRPARSGPLPGPSATPVPVAVPELPRPPPLKAPPTPLLQEAQRILDEERGRFGRRSTDRVDPRGGERPEVAEAPGQAGPDQAGAGPAAPDPPGPAPERPGGEWRTGSHRAAPAGPPPAEGDRRFDIARMAAEVDASERAVARRRIRLASALLVLVGLGAAAAAWYIHRQQVAFRAELQGPHAVTHQGGDYTVEIGVSVSDPAEVSYPGGRLRMEGAQRVRFTVPAEDMRVGTNDLVLTAHPIDRPKARRELVLQVRVHYRLRAEVIPPPQPGVPIIAHVQVMPDWKLAVEGAQTELITSDTYAVRIDPAPLLSRVDGMTEDAHALALPLILTGPNGEQELFRETLQVPLPSTPVALHRPPYNWIGAADQLTVAGAAVPGATVTANGQPVEVDGRGRFEVVVPLPAPGRHTITLEADGPSKRPGQINVQVERLSEAAYAAAVAGIATRLAEARPAEAAPAYAAMRDEAETLRGRAVALKGELLHAARGRTLGVDAVQIATCRGGGRCVVWIDLKGPLLARVGDAVEVVGTLAGTARYRTRSGDDLVVPRLEAELVAP